MQRLQTSPEDARCCCSCSLQDYAYGLGWDPSRDEYKVVFFDYDGLGGLTDQLNSDSLVVAVYSLKSDSWKLLDSPPPKLRSRCIKNSKDWNIHINGFCYWLTSYGHHPSLVSFDVARERFGMVTLPPKVMNGNHTVLSTYYNSPALLYWRRYEVMEIWVL
ncbi:PREDICTED: putative F-box protein At5g52610 [Ipomoea nil]|uniref:putative F-box protein At5g52610 n=1 Tax=Ipomoea nil TaxID=35883 RepID=UPI00090190E6|nr:PREDICTED: putative F-box protein At5g52610 [Ipomoea nil]